MTDAVDIKKRGLFAQLLWLLQHRPGHLFRVTRGYLLFEWARLLRLIFGPGRGISLAQNVRLQKNSALMAEYPDAAVVIGAHSIVYEHAKLEAYGCGRIEIGSGSILGDIRIVSRCRVRIGERFLSSWNIFIQDFDPHPVDSAERRLQVEGMISGFRPAFDSIKPPQPSRALRWNFAGDEIEIGSDVWVGANCTILKGAHIGDSCIVAAGAVVLKGTYPTGSLIAGNPAEVVKHLAGDAS